MPQTRIAYILPERLTAEVAVQDAPGNERNIAAAIAAAPRQAAGFYFFDADGDPRLYEYWVDTPRGNPSPRYFIDGRPAVMTRVSDFALEADPKDQFVSSSQH